MELQKERIEQFLICLDVCLKLNIYQNKFGSRLFIVQFIWATGLQQEMYEIKHLKKPGGEESQVLSAWESLVA